MDSLAKQTLPWLSSLKVRVPTVIRSTVRFHPYFPLAACYFFLNGFGLPVGYFWTSLLSPILYIWLLLRGKRLINTKFLLVLAPFFIAHLILGINNPLEYGRTLAHWWTVYVAVFAICLAMTKCKRVEVLFDQLILANFFVALLGVLAYSTPLRLIFWMDTQPINGAGHALRMRLFTAEPSAYAELMYPLVIFAVLRLLESTRARNIIYLGMIIFPFLLAQSFGGISISFIAVAVVVIMKFRHLLRSTRSRIIFICLVAFTATILLTPNPIAQRVFQVVSGNDGSTQGRTIIAYLSAYTVAVTKSIWWGVGLGQQKFVDFSFVVYGMDGRIPDVIAGLFAEYGIMGVVTLLTVEIYLFFRTKAYKDSFRLAMFVVAFVNQFAASYGSDIQQYIIWFLAFYPLLNNHKSKLTLPNHLLAPQVQE